MSDTVDSLRARIAAVDHGILRLLRERLDLVTEIGVAKRAAGLPVRSFSTEADVLDRYRRAAEELGIEAGLARRIAAEVITAAVRQQEDAVTVPAAEPRRILVVGGAGNMGRWLVRFFAAQGHAVMSCDPAGPAPGAEQVSLERGVSQADVILVATPLSTGPAILRQILALEPQGLVADIFSLKSHVLDALLDAGQAGRQVTSLHPLFGPGVQTLSGRIMAVLDCGNPTAADAGAALFHDTALTVTRLPVTEHDAAMQYVLGLSHLTALLFFTTLGEGGKALADLAPLASTTFNRMARIAAGVAVENPSLYYEIQHLNRHSGELYGQVRAALVRIERAALHPEESLFGDLMEAGRRVCAVPVAADLG